ncbi:hypothetical protein Pan54_31380 [Rubinisphaera italica]|uniref:Uncharacterized protein n=1 Tax=Rubinisphaera italica TaxID=2527969 RepID=A0A5C5XGV2_9PLAN|nr:hypothetical protein Pan54_31380 [Rubinisphaera italica]
MRIAGFFDLFTILGILLDKGIKLFRIRSASTQNEPGDRTVGGVCGTDDRLVGIFGIIGHLLQAGVDLEQRFIHVRANLEFESDCPFRVGTFGFQLNNPLNTFKILLLLDNNLTLNFLGTGSWPTRFHGNRGTVDFRGQLHGHSHESDESEQRHHQDANDDFDRVFDNGFNKRHERIANRGLESDQLFRSRRCSKLAAFF